MITTKTILLPTDGSEYSGKAIACALSFAKQYGAQLVALHVIDQRWEDQTRHTFTEVRQSVLKEAKERREEEARRIVGEVADGANNVGVGVETRIVTGFPVEEILRVGKELQADLIIMGTHGRTGIAHALLGSVAEKVVRRAPCPVLTIHREEHDFVAP